ncbi:MAG: hypothetical protein PHD15_01305 [Clostridia bacterium]|nr:hypothetical protein [Clostridia bacterium]MDD4386386.1 hypothetical protein [Clostridia bacterium]
MNNEFESKRKKIAIVLAVIAGIIIVIMGASILGKGNKINDVTQNTKNVTNYIETIDGKRENISEKIKDTQRVGYIEISDANIVYEKGTSKLTFNITNLKKENTDLNLKLEFLEKDLTKTISKKINVGNILSNEKKKIELSFPEDISNTNIIRYQIID